MASLLVPESADFLIQIIGIWKVVSPKSKQFWNLPSSLYKTDFYLKYKYFSSHNKKHLKKSPPPVLKAGSSGKPIKFTLGLETKQLFRKNPTL